MTIKTDRHAVILNDDTNKPDFFVETDLKSGSKVKYFVSGFGYEKLIKYGKISKKYKHLKEYLKFDLTLWKEEDKFKEFYQIYDDKNNDNYADQARFLHDEN